ncbi:RimK/LysX family protein [Luteimonas sp. SX5]|uniref:RimK/LysX family protein n=1 Tax=Luteimonas galliterrae TaxID=2940486 RepID=A0ABT0MKF9_9GAMM|nr:RimK/LysX family protein [Luteimonas galliterrae]MCL1635371.1 RimK/LysX family protein [Luteimonas galliterrae]
MPDPLVTLGWREWVVLPALGIPRLRAKIDTGARSSALHVDEQWRFSQGGAPWVGFRLSHGKARGLSIQAQAPIHDEREVVDSGGRGERRIFLRTTLRLAGLEREIEINLTNRGAMLFPMLLGRTAMTGLFTIDPASSFLHGRPPRPTFPTGAA